MKVKRPMYFLRKATNEPSNVYRIANINGVDFIKIIDRKRYYEGTTPCGIYS